MTERTRRFFHVAAALFGLMAVIEGIDVGGALGWGMAFLGATSLFGAVFRWHSKTETEL
jgi:hypothetical protein